MTDEKIKPVADGYWWCQNCKNEIGAYHVTNQELHEDCGHPAEWITPVSALAQAREEGRLKGLREAKEIVNKLAENWSKGDFCPDAYDCRDAITRAAEGKS
jgi:hypothetical protein